MPATIHCPACFAKYNVPDATIGRVMKCFKCAKVFEARVADSSPSAAIGSSRIGVPPLAGSAQSIPQPTSDAAEDKPRWLVWAWSGCAVLVLLAFTAIASHALTEKAGRETSPHAWTTVESTLSPAASWDTTKLASPAIAGEIAFHDPDACQYSPDGRLLAIAGDEPKHNHTIRIYDTCENQCIQSLDVRGREIEHLAFSQDGHLMAAATGNDHRVQVWETTTWKPLPDAIAPRNVSPIAFSPSGDLLAGNVLPGKAAEDEQLCQDAVYLWNVKTMARVREIRGDRDLWVAMAFAPDGKTLAVGGGNAVRLYDVHTGAETAQIPIPADPAAVTTLAFSHDGRKLAAGTVNELLLWDFDAPARTPRRHDMKRGGEDTVTFGVRFSPDDQFLATRAMVQPRSSGFAEIVIALALGSDIAFWDVTSGQPRGSIEGGIAFYTQFNSFDVSPEGKRIAVAFGPTTTRGGGVKICDVGK